jgi:hypothetical protein
VNGHPQRLKILLDDFLNVLQISAYRQISRMRQAQLAARHANPQYRGQEANEYV